VHDVTILRISSQDIWDNLTESLWENTFIDVLDGVVYIFLRCRYAALHISLVTHELNCFSIEYAKIHIIWQIALCFYSFLGADYVDFMDWVVVGMYLYPYFQIKYRGN
jgi:hypothetical protein